MKEDLEKALQTAEMLLDEVTRLAKRDMSYWIGEAVGHAGRAVAALKMATVEKTNQ